MMPKQAAFPGMEFLFENTPELMKGMGFISLHDLALSLKMTIPAVGKVVRKMDVNRAVLGRNVYVELRSFEAALKAGGMPNARKGRPPGTRGKRGKAKSK